MSKLISIDPFQKPEGIVAAVTTKLQARRSVLKAMSRAGSGEPTQRNVLAPALTIESRKIAELRPASRQVRRSNAAHAAEIKASMEQFGICVLPLITLDGEIIDGHARIETTKALGISEIQCQVVGHVSATDARRLRIALNRIQVKGEWDFSGLAVELTELNVEFDDDLFIPGIEPQNLDAFLQSGLQMEEVLPQAMVRVAAQVVARCGYAWKLGPHVLARADTRDGGFITHLLETLFGLNKVRPNFSDLPYNVAIQGYDYFHAQYMQNPQMKAGRIIDINRFKTYNVPSRMITG